MNFTHDINPGNGPEVSTVDSGNGFGKHVFWTTVIPNSDVEVNGLVGTARLHVRNLPELDYYSPQGTGDLASLGPTWQSGYFASTVSIDVVWNRPVTRVVNVKDAANCFAGIFAENQATVTWSVKSDSGFNFTSNPGSFSTSVPEIPGVNGVTAPLNFFAQVGFERNGIFFPQRQMQGSAGNPSAGPLVPPAIGPANSVAWDGVGGQPSGESSLGLPTTKGATPRSTLDQSVLALAQSSPVLSTPNGQDVWSAHPRALHTVSADLEGSSLWDVFPNADSPAWAG